MSRATVVDTVHGQADWRDAVDVAKRRLPKGYLFVALDRLPFRGVIPGTWVVELVVTQEKRP